MKKSIFLKLFALLLAACMVFAGCGKDAAVGGADGAGNGEPAETASAENEIVFNSDLIEILEAFKKNRELYNSKIDIENFKTEGNVELIFGSGFGAFVDEMSGQQVSSVFNQIGLKSVALNFDFNRKSDLMSVLGEALINGSYIAEIDTVIDMDNKFVYLASPGLFTGCIGMDVSDTYDFDHSGFSEIVEASNEFYAALDEILVAEEIAGIMSDYLLTAKAELGEPEESVEKVKVDNVSQQLDCVTYTVDEETANKVAIAVLEKFKDDEVIKEKAVAFLEAFVDLAEVSDPVAAAEFGSADDAYDDMIDEVEDTIEDLEETTEFDEEEVDFSIYYADGVFAGIKFGADDDEVIFVTVRDGDNVATELSVTNEYSGKGGFKLVGNDKGGVYNGVLLVGESFVNAIEINIEDLDINELKKGNVNFTLALYGDSLSKASGQEMFSDDFAIKISSKTDGPFESEVKLLITEGNSDILTLIIDSTCGEKSDSISVPASFINADDDAAVEALGQELMNGGIANLLNNIISAGISQEAIMQLMGGLM